MAMAINARTTACTSTGRALKKSIADAYIFLLTRRPATAISSNRSQTPPAKRVA